MSKKKYVLRLLLLILLLIMTLPFSVNANNDWKIKQLNDGSPGCLSPEVSPMNKMSFPYEDTKVRIQVVCVETDNEELIGFTFNNIPNINDTIAGDGYELIETKILWDGEKEEEVAFLHSFDTKSLIPSNPVEMLPKLAKYHFLILSLDWYKEGIVNFKIPLDGSADAIEIVENSCSEN